MPEIKITQSHIKRGRKKDAGCCPIALALLDAVPDRYPAVHYDKIILVDRKRGPGGQPKRPTIRMETSDELHSWLDLYDSDKDYEMGEITIAFNLDLPEPKVGIIPNEWPPDDEEDE